MSVSKLPSGRWRAQVYDPRLGRNVSVSTVLLGESSFPTKTAAKQARSRAREVLARQAAGGVTLRAFWDQWTTDPLFARPKESTNILYRERTKGFVEAHGATAIDQVGDLAVAEWLKGGRRNSTVPALRAMFNDAASAQGGRLVARNPFAGLRISRGHGRRDRQPPTEAQVWELIASAEDVSFPSFGAWLQVAAFTGMRPGELDALRWERVDFSGRRIFVAEQSTSKSRTSTLPKNGKTRDAPLTSPALEALVALPRESEFCFVNLRGGHLTPSARAYHWKAVRAATGWTGDLYLATRHFAGWYMYNVLDMASEDVAIALGHEDGGELVRRLYGHRDKSKALDRAVEAYDRARRVIPIRAAKAG